MAMNSINRMSLCFVLLLALTAAGGCEEMGGLGSAPSGGYGYGGQPPELEGEIQRVDPRSEQIELQTRDARTRTVRYSSRTRVTYGGQDYSVDDLDPGDIVTMRVQLDSAGNTYADLIVVRQPVQERGGIVTPGPQTQRLEGEVGRVDYQRGFFELRDRNRGTVTVSLPYNPPRSVIDRFQELRSGDYVRVEGRFLNQDRFELEEFL